MCAAPKLIVLDRDGVINADSDDYIKSAAEWRALPGSLNAIARLCASGYRVAVVSNQSGIARGLFDRAALAAIDAKMLAAVEGAGGRLAGVYYCTHSPNDGCDCRKPRPGLMRAVTEELNIAAFDDVPVIGDKLADLGLAEAIGARRILVRTGKGRATEDALTPSERHGLEVYDDLAAAVDALLEEER